MPQYHNAAAERPRTPASEPRAYFEQGTKARETGDQYLRNTVLLATVLFLTALAQKFKVVRVRLSLLGVAARSWWSRALLRGHVPDDLTTIIPFG